MAQARAPRCPTCHADVPADAPTFPFCCERCRLADLGSWLDERYHVAGDDLVRPPDEDDEPRH